METCLIGKHTMLFYVYKPKVFTTRLRLTLFEIIINEWNINVICLFIDFSMHNYIIVIKRHIRIKKVHMRDSKIFLPGILKQVVILI